MTNDITSAKKFRDEYFRKIGHGMDDHTVISMMIDYAANLAQQTASNAIDTDALQSSNQALKERISGLEKSIKDFSEENIQLKEKIVSLDKLFKEQTADANVDETEQKAKISKKK